MLQIFEFLETNLSKCMSFSVNPTGEVVQILRLVWVRYKGRSFVRPRWLYRSWTYIRIELTCKKIDTNLKNAAKRTRQHVVFSVCARRGNAVHIIFIMWNSFPVWTSVGQLATQTKCIWFGLLIHGQCFI